MTGLFAAQGELARTQLLQHIPVADSGHLHVDTRCAHGDVQALIAHHRGDQRVRGQLAGLGHRRGQHDHDGVTVDDVPVSVHGQASIRITVVGEPQMRTVGADRLLQWTEMG